MPKTRQQKTETVQNLTDKLNRAKSVVFADYRGLTMNQLSKIRQDLRQLGGELSVTKNTLLKLALKQAKMPPSDDVLSGPTISVFAFEDEIGPVKGLVKALRDFQIGSVKGGIFNHEVLNADNVLKLSALPGKSELRAKAVGVLGAPLYGIVGVLQANLRNLVYVLSQIHDKRGGE